MSLGTLVHVMFYTLFFIIVGMAVYLAFICKRKQKIVSLNNHKYLLK